MRLQLVLGTPLRFIAVGVLNTAIGYALILALQWMTNRPLASNIIGYGISAVASYLNHSRLTFNQRPSKRKAVRFALVMAISYGCNAIVLISALPYVNHDLAQLLAVVTFVVASYIGQRSFVFQL